MLSSRPFHILTEGTYHAPTKTPSRSKARAENAVLGARTVGPKGKSNVLKTPFGPSSVQPSRLLKDVLATQGKAGSSILRQNRPLGDKTPFPNRANNNNLSNQDGFVKVPKLVLLETAPEKLAATPEMQRPSSTRKHSRSRKSLTRDFETPVNNGRHWDVGEIDVGSPEVQVQETIPEDDFDEIEYMPPNTLELAYEPPIDFELPDYKVMGQMFRQQVFSAPLDEAGPPELVLPVVDFADTGSIALPLRELDDDDPFRQAQAPPLAAPVPAKAGVASKLTSRTRPLSAVQPSAAVARGTAQAARARPATAASNAATNSRLVSRPASTAPSAAPRRPGMSAAVSRVASTGTIAAKPTLAGQVAGRTAGPSRTAPLSRAASVASTTSRSTPALRGGTMGASKTAKVPAPEPALFKEVSLDLDDGFMFDV